MSASQCVQALAHQSNVVAAQGVEATLFAALMSILNGGSATGSFLGSLLTRSMGVTSTDFRALAPLLLICNLSSLVPLTLLHLVPDGTGASGVADEASARAKYAAAADVELVEKGEKEGLLRDRRDRRRDSIDS